MPIDCNAYCNPDSQRNIVQIRNNKGSIEEIQDEVMAHSRCIMDCERRNHDAARDGNQGAHHEEDPLPTYRSSGGNRKKYIGKTKSSRSRTRRRVHHRRPRTRTNHRKKTARR